MPDPPGEADHDRRLDARKFGIECSSIDVLLLFRRRMLRYIRCASQSIPAGQGTLMTHRRKPDEERNAATFLALGVLVFLMGGLLILMAIVIPSLLAVALLPLALLIVIAFHYLLWGWWMPKSLGEDETEDTTKNDDGWPPRHEVE